MKNISSQFGFKGKYRVITLRAKPSWIPVKLWLWAYHKGLLNMFVKNVSPIIENHIVLNSNHGLALFFQHMAGIDTYPLELDLAAIGTGTNAPADGDTSLQTPVLTGILRATVDVDLDNIVTEWFITDDELANGTYNEFALYMGTQMFCRSIISPSHTKNSNEDTLIEYTVSGTN